jgi:hypothetical protein
VSASFYWDNSGAAKRVADAVPLVTGQQSSGSLIGLWQGRAHPRWPNLIGVNALLMNGSTGDLQKALLAAKQAHLEGLWSTADALLFWFVRRKPGTFADTKTVLSIAPMRGYWGIIHNNPAQVEGAGLWVPMSDPGTYDNGVSIDTIVNMVLPAGEGRDAWIKY